jgi:hypothetical protein
MPWVKPKARPENGDTINVSDLEILAPYHALLSGGADEHNFATDGLSATIFPPSSLVKVHVYSKDLAHGMADGVGVPGGAFYGIAPYRQWVPLIDQADGDEIVITVTTGRCTAQCHFSAMQALAVVVTPVSPGYLQFGIEVDGVLDMNGATHNVDSDWPTGQGHAVACDAIFDLEAGVHTFRVMGYCHFYQDLLGVRALQFTVIERRA